MNVPEESATRTPDQIDGPTVDLQPGSQEPTSVASPTPRNTGTFRDGETLIQSLLSIIVIVLFVITFIVQAFQIPSESMERTLLVGDYLLVDKIHFGEPGLLGRLLPYRDLQRGDIVVFHYPLDTSQHYVKRVIGLPGDRIRMRNKTVFVNDRPLRESYVIHSAYSRDSYRDNFPSDTDYTGQVESRWRSELEQDIENGAVVVPPGHYFVMGDNRDRSLDSRYWGFVPRGNIVGRPLVIYLSVRSEGGSGSTSKLYTSGRLLAHVWQFARWDRIFHLVQ
jgi:signal peptidase I